MNAYLLSSRLVNRLPSNVNLDRIGVFSTEGR